jgi:hypothetical protein
LVDEIDNAIKNYDEIGSDPTIEEPVQTPIKGGKGLHTPTFGDLQKWAEEGYKLDIIKIGPFFKKIATGYNHVSASKVTLVTIAAVCMIKQFFENKIIQMNDAEISAAKWSILKSLFPGIGNGPVSIIKWTNLLQVTSEPYFHTMPESIFNDIQRTARILIDQHENGKAQYSDVEMEHWKKIVDGEVPYGFRLIKDVEAQKEIE